MNACETYFAILKGYTTVSIFALPIGFKYGGWLFSPCILIFSCFVECTLAIRLSLVANKVQIYSYPELTQFILGKPYSIAL